MRNVLIDQVLIIGDGRKYITALICPNWDEILKLCDANGVPYDKEKLRYELVNGMNICVEVGPELANSELVKRLLAIPLMQPTRNWRILSRLRSSRYPRESFYRDLMNSPQPPNPSSE